MNKVDSATALGYGLMTAEILYYMPDHRFLLQSYLWQTGDIYPEFPRLHKFLGFWVRELEAPLHSVRVAHSRLLTATEFQFVDGMLRLN